MIAHLGRLDQRRDNLPVLLDVQQRGRRIGVHVPDVVMHELAAPHHFAGFRLHRHGGGGVGHLLQTVAAIIVRAGRGGRQERQAGFRIDRDRSPDVGGAGDVFHVRRDDIEGPFQRAGARVDAEHRAGIFGLVDPVQAGPAQDQRVLVDGGRLNESQLELLVLGRPGIDIHDAIVAEARALLARIGIHAMQFAKLGADIDHLLAGLAGFGQRRSPVSNAAALQALTFRRAVGSAGGIDPLGLAGVRLDREDAVPGGADIDGVVDEQGRGAPGGGAFAAGNVTGMDAPGALQILHIFGSDLGGGGIFLGLLVAAKGIPDLVAATGHHHHGILRRRAKGRQVYGGGRGRAERRKGGGFHLSLHLRPHPSRRCARWRC